MKSITHFLIAFALLGIVGCNSDDENGYVSLTITTQTDRVTLFQGASIAIAIFSNDQNIPENGLLSLSETIAGSLEVSENNTSTILDDTILFTSNGTYLGDSSFQYTICDAVGGNCKTETVSLKVFPPVNVQLDEVPYATLSEYNFFDGTLALQEPVPGVLPYEPISILFSDYAHKKRFVWLPENTQARYQADGDILTFPTGAVLIKSFFYENVIPNNTTQLIETRLLIKKNEGWIFANYFWNEEQTEAYLDVTGDGGFKEVTWIENGETRNHNYRIPSTSECFTCHKSNEVNFPIGVKPQNLNGDYGYPSGIANQLTKWIDVGYLENNLPNTIQTVVDYSDPSQSLDLRVRSYFDINCAHCHRDEAHCNYRSMRFAFDENNTLENRGVCVTPDTPLPGDFDDPKIIKPGDVDNSIIYYRLNTAAEELRMPLLGRRIVHEEGVALIEEWILSLHQICD